LLVVEDNLLLVFLRSHGPSIEVVWLDDLELQQEKQEQIYEKYLNFDHQQLKLRVFFNFRIYAKQHCL
jgi:hypothetical protein